MMSFYVIPPDSLQMKGLLKPLMDDNKLIKVIDERGGLLQNIPGVGWMNTIGKMKNAEGYYIKVAGNDTLTVIGKPIMPPFSIPLQSGWNMMGYPLQQEQDAITDIQPLIDNNYLIKVISQTGGLIQNIPGVGWMNTIGKFTPGEGYYVKVNHSTSISMDSHQYAHGKNTLIVKPSVNLPPSHYFNKVFTGNPYYPVNVVVTSIDLSGYSPKPGDEIAVFDKDRCVGVGQVQEDVSLPVNIVASMDDPVTSQIDGYTRGDPVTIKYRSATMNSPVVVSKDILLGTDTFTPLETLACKISASSDEMKKHLVNGSSLLSIYPNPVKGSAAFVLNNPATAHVRIELTDLAGRVVKLLYDNTAEKGILQFHYDLSSLVPGIYTIRVIRKGEKENTSGNYKLVITR
jgi:hypothetical protein